jgi:hypothetical protein
MDYRNSAVLECKKRTTELQQKCKLLCFIELLLELCVSFFLLLVVHGLGETRFFPLVVSKVQESTLCLAIMLPILQREGGSLGESVSSTNVTWTGKHYHNYHYHHYY